MSELTWAMVQAHVDAIRIRAEDEDRRAREARFMFIVPAYLWDALARQSGLPPWALPPRRLVGEDAVYYRSELATSALRIDMNSIWPPDKPDLTWWPIEPTEAR